MNEEYSNISSKNDKLISLEERVLSFIEYSSQKNHNKTKPFNRNKEKFDNYTTMRDSLIHLNQIRENDSHICTQTKYKIDDKNSLDVRKSISIKRELLKGAEPRFKIDPTPILQPKFRNLELSNSIKSLLKHNITQSVTDILEIDEKIPQYKLEQIEKKKNEIIIGKDFSFKLLKEEEKVYEEMLKDFKGNGLSNIRYKQKLSATYLSILLNEKNTIGNIFLNNKDINQFVIREMCVFLSILFLDEFKGLTENELTDFKNCLTYCHYNFLFILMLIVNNTKEEYYQGELDKLNYNEFLKCKNILNAVDDKIDYEKYKNNFHSQNKIIKSLLLNLLNNLGYLNQKIAEQLQLIFDSAKKSTINEVIINKIQNNNLIINKVQFISEEENEKETNKKNKYNTYSTEKKKEEKDYNINNIIENLLNDKSENLEESEDEILPQPDPPFLPLKDINDKREYTLVLDLDETLVHYFENNEEENAYVKVRMGAEKFIKILSEYCEIVIFTASTQDYANIVIDGLDCSENISYRLYRQHTNVINGYNIKDLSKLGRDISKMIIVDNIEENYNLQPDNGLNIIDFEGDENDNELNFLLEDLLEIVKEKNVDVRKKLPDVRKKMQRRYANIN